MTDWLTPTSSEPAMRTASRVTHIASYDVGSLCGIPWATMVRNDPTGAYIPPTLTSTAHLDGVLLQDALMRHAQMASCEKCREIFLRGVFASKVPDEK